MNTPMRIGLTAGLFVFIFLFGFWLSRAGRPYNGVLFNLHKLISLGTIVFLGFTIASVNRTTPLGAAQITAIVITALFFVGTIATGGVMSAVKEPAVVVHRLHQILPYLTALSTAGTLYLLFAQSEKLVML